MTGKRSYHLQCRHCRGLFVEMKDLLFHPCPAQSDARKSRRARKRRPVKGKVAVREL